MLCSFNIFDLFLSPRIRNTAFDAKYFRNGRILVGSRSAILRFCSQPRFSPQAVENDITEISKRVNELAGIKESDTGLAPPALWDLAADKQSMQSEQPLQVRNSHRLLHLFG